MRVVPGEDFRSQVLYSSFFLGYQNSNYYLAHAYNAYGEYNVFTLSLLPSVHRVGWGGGSSGHYQFLANLPRHEHFLAKDPHPIPATPSGH